MITKCDTPPKCPLNVGGECYHVSIERKVKLMATKLNFEQASRYRELMWIAQFGDYMSNAEYDELAMLMKLKDYK